MARIRKRITIAKLQKSSSRQVTFSKRRSGLFKKASELCILCEAEVAIVVFSPGGKAFSLGHPSMHTIIDRFLSGEPAEEEDVAHMLIRAKRNSEQSERNFYLAQLEDLIVAQTKRGKAIDKSRRETEGRVYWEKPLETLRLEQMESFMENMVVFVDNIKEEARALELQERASALQLLDVPLPLLTNDGVPLNPLVGITNGQLPLVNPNGQGLGGGVPFNTTVANDAMGMGLGGRVTNGQAMTIDPMGPRVGDAPFDPTMAMLEHRVSQLPFEHAP